MLIVGVKEQTAGTVSVRDRALGEGKEADLGAMTIPQLIEHLGVEVREKKLRGVVRVG